MNGIKIFLATFILFFITNAKALEPWQVDSTQLFHPVVAKHGMVASQDSYASEAGLQILKQGGNAVDAAVAVGFALAVTLPRAGNLGGGGFMLIWLNKSHIAVAIDYREVAPVLAYPKLFLDDKGNINVPLSVSSYLSSAVPGTVAGLSLALQRYGTMSLRQVMQPAIQLAKQGFTVNPAFASSLIASEKKLKQSPESTRIFFKKDGSYYIPGDQFIQPDLAHSLELIALQGSDAFYKGEITQKTIDAMQKNKGIMTAQDFAQYKPIIRQPVQGKFNNYTIISMPPPSAGGIILIEMLNILEKYPLKTLGLNSAQTIHLMTEVINLAYADRNHYLGDPSFVKIPVEKLLSKQYADKMRKLISTSHHTPIQLNAPFNRPESHETTHFSVVDKEGNMVANTYTLDDSFGSGITIPGTGILLNNEMTDFALKEGEIKTSGSQSNNNLISPKKRPLSSMSPTIILTPQGEPFVATGTPGGFQITSSVLQVILNILVHQLNIQGAIAMPRFHSQQSPDMIIYEQGLSNDTLNALRKLGHKTAIVDTIGAAETVALKDGFRLGAVDPRRPNASAVGY